jgi:hypothetical protein
MQAFPLSIALSPAISMAKVASHQLMVWAIRCIFWIQIRLGFGSGSVREAWLQGGWMHSANAGDRPRKRGLAHAMPYYIPCRLCYIKPSTSSCLQSEGRPQSLKINHLYLLYP